MNLQTIIKEIKMNQDNFDFQNSTISIEHATTNMYNAEEYIKILLDEKQRRLKQTNIERFAYYCKCHNLDFWIIKEPFSIYVWKDTQGVDSHA